MLVLGVLALSLVGVASAIPPEATPDRPHEPTTTDTNHTTDSKASSPGIRAKSDSNTPNQVFEKTFFASSDAVPNDLLRTQDGNYVFMGADSNADGSFDAGITKVTPSGEIIWSNVVENSNNQSFYSGTQTSDGGFIIAGYIEQNTPAGWLVKLDSNGEREWTNAFSYGAGGALEDATETESGEYLFGGQFEASDGTNDAEVVKTTSDGTIKWNFSYAHYDHDASQDFFGIAAGQGDTYYLAGQEYNNDNWDALAVEINSVGEEVSSRTYGHDNLDDWFYDVTVDSDGDPYYAGLRNGIYNESAEVYDFGDAWVYHDGFGDWSQTASTDDANVFGSISVQDGSVVASGRSVSVDTSTSDGLAAAYDLSGTEQWRLTTTDSYSQDLGTTVATDSGAYFAAVEITSEGGAENITLSEYTTQPLLSTSLSAAEVERATSTNLTLTVTNSSTGLPVAGVTVSNEQLGVSTTTNQSGVASFEIDHDAAGNYSLQVSHPDYYDTSTGLSVVESTPVELSNVSFSGGPVTNETDSHTLSFDVANLSADGNADEFTVTLPETVDLDSVESVTVADTNLQPSYDTNDKQITFDVNREGETEIQQLSLKVDLRLSSNT